MRIIRSVTGSVYILGLVIAFCVSLVVKTTVAMGRMTVRDIKRG